MDNTRLDNAIMSLKHAGWPLYRLRGKTETRLLKWWYVEIEGVKHELAHNLLSSTHVKLELE